MPHEANSGVVCAIEWDSLAKSPLRSKLAHAASGHRGWVRGGVPPGILPTKCFFKSPGQYTCAGGVSITETLKVQRDMLGYFDIYIYIYINIYTCPGVHDLEDDAHDIYIYMIHLYTHSLTAGSFCLCVL